MIECFSLASAHLFGGILADMHRFRYRVFVLDQGYQVPHADGMSWDAYDTPATRYLVHRDPEGNIDGMIRLFPTTFPYMIREHWPHLIGGELPSALDTWEASRFAVTASGERRRHVIRRLVLASVEFALLNNVRTYIGVMPPAFWDRVFVRNGCPIEFLGPDTRLPGYDHPVIAGKCNVTRATEQVVRDRTSLSGRVLTTVPRPPDQEA